MTAQLPPTAEAPHRFVLAELPATPWKNGGGTTREIACWPSGAGLDGFDWRVSVARIAAAGPFSAFAGVDRTIVLLDGAGVRLRSADGAIDHRLDRPLAPFGFAGEAALDCELLDEGTRAEAAGSSDFNVMTRRGRFDTNLRIVRDAAALAPSAHGLLLAVAGGWSLRWTGATPGTAGDAPPPTRLAPGEGVWWAGAVPRALAVEAMGTRDGAALIAVVFIQKTSAPHAGSA